MFYYKSKILHKIINSLLNIKVVEATLYSMSVFTIDNTATTTPTTTTNNSNRKCTLNLADFCTFI